MYSRCRTRIVALGADEATHARLKILSPSDIKASTAIINPNEPGSSTIKLSWIWQTAGGHRFGLDGIDEIGAGASSTNAEIGAGERLLECRSFC